MSLSIAERLALQSVPEPNTGCVLWTGCVTAGGYGRVWTGEKMIYAHRAAYELRVGPIQPTLVVDHKCRVRACVNPDHLEPVTNRENILRGVGCSATAARVTHCPSGHPYSGANVRVYQGVRYCRACKRVSDRIRYLTKVARD